MGVNDAAFPLRLRAHVSQKEALAADDGSFQDEQAAVFAGIDCVDLFVERLLINPGAVDKHRNDVGMAQALAMVLVVRVVCSSGAPARSLLLRLF